MCDGLPVFTGIAQEKIELSGGIGVQHLLFQGQHPGGIFIFHRDNAACAGYQAVFGKGDFAIKTNCQADVFRHGDTSRRRHRLPQRIAARLQAADTENSRSIHLEASDTARLLIRFRNSEAAIACIQRQNRTTVPSASAPGRSTPLTVFVTE